MEFDSKVQNLAMNNWKSCQQMFTNNEIFVYETNNFLLCM
jgi:hypothetical protein